MMLLLGLTVELQQLHHLGMYLGRAMPGEDGGNCQDPAPLVHGQDSLRTKVGSEIPMKSNHNMNDGEELILDQLHVCFIR